jgi:hypothetical protein
LLEFGHYVCQAHGDTVRTRELGGRIAAVVRAVAIAKAEGAILERGVVAPIWEPQKMMNLHPLSQSNQKLQQAKPTTSLPQEPLKQVAKSIGDDDVAVPSFDSLADTVSGASSSFSKIFDDGFLASSIKGKSQQQPLALLEEHAKKKRLGSVYVRIMTTETVCTDSCPHSPSIYISKAYPLSLPPPKFFVVIGSKTFVLPNG